MDFDLSQFLPYQLSSAAQAVSKAFADRYSQAYGLTIAEWRVLAHLHQADQVSVRDVHLMVGMDKPKVSRAAARLREKGYVNKGSNPGDGRLVKLSLTEKGHQVMEDLIPIALKFEAELLTMLGHRAGDLRESLTRLNDAASHRH